MPPRGSGEAKRCCGGWRLFKPECGDCPLSLCRGDFHLYVAEAMCSDLGNYFPLHIEICDTLYSFSEIPFAVSLTIVLCDDGLIPPALVMHLFLCRFGIWVVPLGLLTEREVVFNTSDCLVSYFWYPIVAVSYLVTVHLNDRRRQKNIRCHARLFHVQDFVCMSLY